MIIRLSDKIYRTLSTPIFFVATLLLMSCDSNPTKSYRESLNWRTFNTANTGGGLTCDRVRSIVADKMGNLWFGSCGLSRYNGSTWESFTNTGNAFPYSIYSIAIDTSGELWISLVEYFTDKGFIFRFDGTKFTEIDPDSEIFGHKVAWQIAVDSAGVIWFATQGRGIIYYDGASWDSVKQRTPFKVSDYITSVFVDRDNIKWFASGSKLVRYDDINWTNYISPGPIHCISQDLDGLLWLTSLSAGVFSYDGSTWTVYDTVNSGLSSNYVLECATDRDNTKWFTTDKGVCKFDGTSWQTFTSRNSGLVSNYVLSVAIDLSNHKWFGTFENGVSVLK